MHIYFRFWFSKCESFLPNIFLFFSLSLSLALVPSITNWADLTPLTIPWIRLMYTSSLLNLSMCMFVCVRVMFNSTLDCQFWIINSELYRLLEDTRMYYEHMHAYIHTNVRFLPRSRHMHTNAHTAAWIKWTDLVAHFEHAKPDGLVYRLNHFPFSFPNLKFLFIFSYFQSANSKTIIWHEPPVHCFFIPQFIPWILLKNFEFPFIRIVSLIKSIFSSMKKYSKLPRHKFNFK